MLLQICISEQTVSRLRCCSAPPPVKASRDSISPASDEASMAMRVVDAWVNVDAGMLSRVQRSVHLSGSKVNQLIWIDLNQVPVRLILPRDKVHFWSAANLTYGVCVEQTRALQEATTARDHPFSYRTLKLSRTNRSILSRDGRDASERQQEI